MTDHADEFLDAVDTFARSVRRTRGTGATTASAGLTLSQYGLLLPLLDQGETRVRDLADAAGVTPATATNILDALERRGLVGRDRSARDRRTVTVTLTSDGRAALKARHAATRELERAMYDSLSRRERVVAPGLLYRLAALIDELAALDAN